jgi:hypothetical protein
MLIYHLKNHFFVKQVLFYFLFLVLYVQLFYLFYSVIIVEVRKNVVENQKIMLLMRII